ncbi:unnamed protein product [Brassicogethes aeneus]|uniref:Uncharacterized protein n=1 Tax=Brassicogethes aeneus TaxID=1431903 RepID=A0A9P0BD30_BRAAE|nr:unnamed protein product [Brassicogethes aeneus]
MSSLEIKAHSPIDKVQEAPPKTAESSKPHCSNNKAPDMPLITLEELGKGVKAFTQLAKTQGTPDKVKKGRRVSLIHGYKSPRVKKGDRNIPTIITPQDIPTMITPLTKEVEELEEMDDTESISTLTRADHDNEVVITSPERPLQTTTMESNTKTAEQFPALKSPTLTNSAKRKRSSKDSLSPGPSAFLTGYKPPSCPTPQDQPQAPKISDPSSTQTAGNDKNKEEFHTYMLPENKLLQVVIRGIPSEIDIKEVEEELKSLGYTLSGITRMKKAQAFPNKNITMETFNFFENLDESASAGKNFPTLDLVSDEANKAFAKSSMLQRSPQGDKTQQKHRKPKSKSKDRDKKEKDQQRRKTITEIPVTVTKVSPRVESAITSLATAANHPQPASKEIGTGFDIKYCLLEQQNDKLNKENERLTKLVETLSAQITDQSQMLKDQSKQIANLQTQMETLIQSMPGQEANQSNIMETDEETSHTS